MHGSRLALKFAFVDSKTTTRMAVNFRQVLIKGLTHWALR